MRRFEHFEVWIPPAILVLAYVVERGRKALAEAARRRREPGGPRQYEPIEPESPWRRLLDGVAVGVKRLQQGWHYFGIAAGVCVVFLGIWKGDLPKALGFFVAVLLLASLALRNIRSRGLEPGTDAPPSIREVSTERREEP